LLKSVIRVAQARRSALRPVIAARLQLSSARKRTFSYDVVWDDAAILRASYETANPG